MASQSGSNLDAFDVIQQPDLTTHELGDPNRHRVRTVPCSPNVEERLHWQSGINRNTTNPAFLLLEAYRAQRRELRRGRLDIPRRIPPMSGHDLWNSNRPGSTLFLPICDVSAWLISLIAQFVDPALRRYAPAGGGMNIVDDRHGCRPAGTERWLKDGFLNAEQILPLSIVERQACYYTFSEPATICQNMSLATEALGLGGWKRCGFLSLAILERIGFRVVAAKGAATFGNPVGLDGVFEASCPPYHPSMDAAVDAVLTPPSPSRKETGPVPHRMSDAEHRRGFGTARGECWLFFDPPSDAC